MVLQRYARVPAATLRGLLASMRCHSIIAILFVLCVSSAARKRSFKIENDRFIKDGEPIQIFSGSIHYQRIHPEYWRDRLLRVKAMGLNTIQWYVTWNVHEPKPGVYNWEGFADVERFLELANELDLMVLFRPGPYACGEWEFGGFPYWLASDRIRGGGTMTLRVSDEDYLKLVDRWWSILLPRLSRFLYSRGGPIVLAQIENEYGFCWRSPDAKYLNFLKEKLHQYMGDDVIIYTTDPPAVIQRGTLPSKDVYSVVDFGPGTNVEEAFRTQKAFNPPGLSPPLCSEYYTGWITQWGDAMANTSADLMMRTLTEIVQYGNNTGSVNLYMAHGGTNFGYWAGANVQSADPTPPGGLRHNPASTGALGLDHDVYKPVVTTYDYDCPVSESGRTGQPGIGGPNKFELIRALFTRLSGKKAIDFPDPLPIKSYGTISLDESTLLLDAVAQLYPGDGIYSQFPERMENYDQAGGFTVYRTYIPDSHLRDGATLDIGAPVHDYAQVLLNGKVQGSLERNNPRNLTLVSPASPSNDGLAQLDIVVHALGRVNFGCIWDFKGLVNPSVRLNGQTLTGWRVFPLELTDLSIVNFAPKPSTAERTVESRGSPSRFGPVLFRGHFNIDSDTVRGSTGHLPDTYVSVRGWGKGLAFVNGFNLGWYWPNIGPQGAQYVPGPLLKEGRNEIILLEVEIVHHAQTVELTSEADLSGPTSALESAKAAYINTQHEETAFDKSQYLPSVEKLQMPRGKNTSKEIAKQVPVVQQ